MCMDLTVVELTFKKQIIGTGWAHKKGKPIIHDAQNEGMDEQLVTNKEWDSSCSLHPKGNHFNKNLGP